MILFYFILNYIILILLWHIMRHICCGAEVNNLLGKLMQHRCCGAEVIYFLFNSEMENRNLSQICGRLYLPIFLFRVGLLTQKYIASLMALAIMCPSLPIILKLSAVVVWSVVFWCSKIGDGAFKCSLNCSSNVLADFPIYSSSDSVLPYLSLHIMLLCFVTASLSFGNISRFFVLFFILLSSCFL